MNKKQVFEAKRMLAVLVPAVIFGCNTGGAADPTASIPPPSELTEGTLDDERSGRAGEFASDPSPTGRHNTGSEDLGGGDAGSDAASGDAGSDGAPISPGDPPTKPTEPSTPTEPPSVVPTWPMPFRGVNLAGGEFGSAIPGRDGYDYQFPTNDEVDYFVAKGMNTFRVGFKWERMQPEAYGDLVTAYVSQVDAIVAYATSKGAFIVLNPHNFARYYETPVGSSSVPNAVFADFWRRLSSRYVSNPRVMFNLVNEPRDMPTEQWVGAANAAIASIRATGATNTIIVPGNGWTGAHSWTSSWYGTPNSVAMLDIVDSGDNVLFEAHQYLDADSGGSSSTCVSSTIGTERMRPFVDWLKANHKKGFLGEFAGADNSTCNTAVRGMLDYMMENTDVLVGWLWWAAGPGWGEYKFTIEPSGGQDRPQMSLLSPYLTH